MDFTTDQQKVIDTRKKNILVSAAAGSGKTAVLVERICELVTDAKNPVDIDRLLVVTFTNASASEMRERVHSAIVKKLEDDPENENLLRQSILVNRAMITTIDSFCRFILMNHFQEINLDPGFNIGDSADMLLLQKEAMELTMEKAYVGEGFYDGFYEEFTELANSFAKKGRDHMVESMIETLFHFSESNPYPEKWLSSCLLLNHEAMWNDVSTIMDRRIKSVVLFYDQMFGICSMPEGPGYLIDFLQEEKEYIESLLFVSDYEEKASKIEAFKFGRKPSNKNQECDKELDERVAKIRDNAKKKFNKITEDYCIKSKQDYEKDVEASIQLLRPLIALTIEFSKTYSELKRKENVIDFSDMEHFALKILVDENRQPTKTALMYQEYFKEVMIDEYQDSNDVQELLLSVVSKEYDDEPNRFMVGDMKQSIYKFRMARPEIFLEKYHAYADESDKTVRIDLKQNFRSRKEVLDVVNEIFYPLMGEDVGSIQYNEEQALYLGAKYKEPQVQNAFEPELLVYEQVGADGEKTDLSKEEGEALVLAKKIKELMETGTVTDKKTGEARRVEYDDIVILARSMGDLTNTIQQVFKRQGIPCSVPSKVGFFSSIEVQAVLNLVKVVLNPYHDIPLVALLHSPIYHFSDEEIAEISMVKIDSKEKHSFYEKVIAFSSDKTKAFLEELETLRKTSKTETVHDFLYKYLKTHQYFGYMNAMPAGQNRKSNVDMLLEEAVRYESIQLRGLFGFLQYMKQLEKYEVDYGDGKDDGLKSVKIMTIHKSKGLEFPICIVAGLNKEFNKKDLSKPVLFHADQGIAMQFRNYKKRVYRNTMRNVVLSDYLLNDLIGEELRVLYVALTRAKEKLILSAAVSEFEKELTDAYSFVTPRNPSLRVQNIDSQLILDSKTYFSMLIKVYAFYEEKSKYLPKVSTYKESDLNLLDVENRIKMHMKKEQFLNTIAVSEDEDEKMSYAYPHPELAGLYTKTSVSELKKASLHIDEQTLPLFEVKVPEDTSDIEEKAKSRAKLRREIESTPLGALKGSATHRFMELLDFKRFGSIELDSYESEIHSQLTVILEEKKMTKEETDLIDIKKICVFMTSSLAKEMIAADEEGLLFREQPFVLSVEATRLNPQFSKDEKVIIQGIIDVFYIKEDEVYLLDYKTDQVKKIDELVSRYGIQLDYYKETLERITGKKVVKNMIYSFKFNEMIEL